MASDSPNLSELERLPLEAYLFKNFLSPKQQEELYNKEIFRTRDPSAKPWSYSSINAIPISQYNNVFTQDSNIQKPEILLKYCNLALDTVKALQSGNSNSSPIPEHLIIPESTVINNCFTQLYPANGQAVSHVDAYLTWVASLSIVDSCEFAFGESKSLKHKITIRSGDLLIFNGGKVFHSVLSIEANSAPPFWRTSAVENFGLARCNIQLRDSTSVDKNCPQKWRDMFSAKNLGMT